MDGLGNGNPRNSHFEFNFLAQIVSSLHVTFADFPFLLNCPTHLSLLAWYVTPMKRLLLAGGFDLLFKLENFSIFVSTPLTWKDKYIRCKQLLRQYQRVSLEIYHLPWRLDSGNCFGKNQKMLWYKRRFCSKLSL